MKKKDFYDKLRNHPELFDANELSEFELDEKDVPPLPQWFYDFKDKEQQKKTKQTNLRVLIAIPICVAVALVFLVTPVGKSLAEGSHSLFVRWSENLVSAHYGKEDNTNFEVENIYSPIKYDTIDRLRNDYSNVIIAENTGYTIDGDIYVNESELGLQVEMNYVVGEGIVKIDNLCYNKITEISFIASSKDENAQPIDLTLKDGTRAIGFYDRESGVAAAYYDRLETFFTTQTVSYDEFVKFIETTVIR